MAWPATWKIPVLGRFPGEGKGYTTQYSGLENSMDYTGHKEPKSGTQLNAWASLIAQLIKNLPAMQETPVQFLCWGRSPGEEEGYPLQFSGLENSMDCTAHGVTKSQHTCMTFTLLVNSVQLRFNSRMKTNNLFIPTIYVSYFLLDYAFYMPP